MILICTYQNHNRNNIVQHRFDFRFLAFAEAGIADADNLVQVVLDPFRRVFFRYFGSQTF